MTHECSALTNGSGDKSITAAATADVEETCKLSAVINDGCDDESTIIGFIRCPWRCLLAWAGCLMTAFALRLVLYWRPDWRVKCTHRPCHLRLAQAVLVKDQYNQIFVHKVHLATEAGLRVRPVETPRAGGGFGRFLASARNRSEHEVDDESAEVDQLAACEDAGLIRYFFHKKVKYIWDSDSERFAKIEVFASTPCSLLHQARGLSNQEAAVRRARFGRNRVFIPLTPLWRLFVLKFLHPFYIFLLFSVCLWFFQGYWMYATCIIMLSLLSLALAVSETARNERNLRKTLVSSDKVTVTRNFEDFSLVDSDLLVPGDVLEIPRSGCVMHCDAVLLSGNCIMNESMLTGESVPVLKTPLPNPSSDGSQLGKRRAAAEPMFSIKEHARHVLYCGTQVIQTRYIDSDRVRAVVVRSGFATAKGELVRAILFPKPAQFRFDRDIARYLLVLGLFAAAGFAYTVAILSQRGEALSTILMRALDMIVIVVPPALPSAMTVGIVFAQSRLRKSGIFCISSNQINVSGTLDLVCFDKTGTLTEDGLDLWGGLPAVLDDGARFAPVVRCPRSELPADSGLLAAMAACHSLTRIDGRLSGDPLDLKMFEATGWELEEPEPVDYRKFDQLVSAIVRPPQQQQQQQQQQPTQDGQLGIVRQFAFSSSLQRMSVIARQLGADHFTVYTKGSPEVVRSLCRPETVPADFHDSLAQFTRQGYRVIGLAGRPLRVSYLKAQKLSRDAAERDLGFLGLLVMENRLKPETGPAIGSLLAARIRLVMVTGDNLLTALSVARDCGMIADRDSVILVQGTPEQPPFKAQVDFHYAGDLRKKVSTMSVLSDRDLDADIRSGRYHLAMTGRSWDIVRAGFPQLLPRLLVKGTVFARFSPDQKAQLVEALQKVGYTVGMCGDGANDCGALKAADSGIALSEAEASVASPFTSRRQNIACVPTLIREGRCALVTSFGIFKFMAAYSLAQFASCLILNYAGSNLTDSQFLYIDLFLITSLSVTFGRSEAFKRLSKRSPSINLMSAATVASIAVLAVNNVAFQAIALMYTRVQPWFYAKSDGYPGYENTAVFLVSSSQYISTAVVLAKSAPYRQRLIRNYLLLANVLITLAVNTCIMFTGIPWINKQLELWQTPRDNPSQAYRLLLAGAALMNFLLAYLAEQLIDSQPLRRSLDRLGHRIRVLVGRGGGDVKEFERVRAQLASASKNVGAKGDSNSEAWPPITRVSSCQDTALMCGDLPVAASGGVIDDGVGEVDDLGRRSRRRPPRRSLRRSCSASGQLSSDFGNNEDPEAEGIEYNDEDEGIEGGETATEEAGNVDIDENSPMLPERSE